MGRFSIWYKGQKLLRAVVKYIGLGALDFYIVERANDAVIRIKANSAANVGEFIDLLNTSVEIGSKLTVVVPPGRGEAKYINEGQLELSEKEVELEHKIVDDFPDNWSNDICGVVLEKPNWREEPLIIRYRSLSYGGALARRQLGKYTGMISANVFIVCEERRCVLFHRRSATQKDYPRALHTYGGAFIPPGTDPRDDHSGVRRTALRELIEEADIGVHIPKQTIQIVIDEYEIQFIQAGFIGVNISSIQLDEAGSNWEGDPVVVNFDDLYGKAKDLSSWTPTGWAHLFIWLSLDCPGTTFIPTFNEDSPKDLARKLAQKCLTKRSKGPQHAAAS